MVDSPRERGDDAQGAEYWRREADRLQGVVDDLRRQIDELTAPTTMTFQGVENGVVYERSIIRIPEDHWEPEVEHNPELASWDWATTGGLCFLLSPLGSAESIRVPIAGGQPVSRRD
jgi:hypothetical protein